MDGVELWGLTLVVLLTMGACAGKDGEAARARVTASSSSATFEARPLDCPNGRFETAQADFYGEEPMKPYQGAATPEAALEDYVGGPTSGYSRVSEQDPAYRYFAPSTDQAVFVRVEADGSRTTSVLLRPSSAGGWQGAAHIACEVSPAGD